MGLLRLTGSATEDVELLRSWIEAAAPPLLVITTSGSTGAPKEVLLSRDAVLASAAASADRLGGSGSWRLVLPSAYVAGVNVICRCLLAGCEPLLDDRPGAADYLSLVPTQLHRALAEDAAALRGYRAILVGGGPVSRQAWERAGDAGVHLVATYGSSETTGGCVYDGAPLDGVRVALEQDGRIRLAGPTLFDGYTDPALTAEFLVEGWFRTSDAGSLDRQGRLTVLGRLDDVVISGGVKVPLPAVSERLVAHPSVSAAEAVGVADAEWGQRVVAVVVGSLSLAAARDWVAEVHPRTWAPRELVRVDALPLLANGKPDRRALQDLAAGA